MARSNTKNSLLPSVRVGAELRQQVEKVLAEDESLSSFIEASVRSEIHERLTRQAFLQRGLQSKAQAKETSVYYSAEHVMDRLDEILANRKAKKEKG
ncbi:MAG TPA: YlcI/YnfO family protein [Dyella sp.]|uniref:YlcI/YnfO family protein n=1 Tax=Dyella sp. TaxID=1869338 RepID=UPI002BE80FBA|nr:YlcI/YnfO family protein [Dyella sp.]HUB89261.1 YlcI/YnfO family protein [Dyella sp.]